MISTSQNMRVLAKSRGKRRAVVAGYWFLVAFGCFAFLMQQARHGSEDFAFFFVLEMIIVLPGLLGGVRPGGLVKPFRQLQWISRLEQDGLQPLLKPPTRPSLMQDASLDERETHERDRVHFIAFTPARWFALLLFAVYGVAGALQVSWFSRVGPFFFFLLTVTLWSLPQSMIFWSEPDIEEQS